jgi:serine/threonine protein kinase/Flp pilus assembly protein TadD
MIGQTIGHYQILDLLGQGGMGEVYVANDLNLDRRVALKRLPDAFANDPERLERFEREAKILASLNHPNVVTIHSVEDHDGLHFFTMELIDGESLDRLIPKGGFTLESFLELAIPLAEALGRTHDHGVQHRDLKPANIMLTRGGQLKVLDFGLAAFRSGAPVSSETLSTLSVEQEGRIEGTIPYMSPEQVQGQLTDFRSDIFSLGVVLYEMATGVRPFVADNPVALTSAILSEEQQAIETVKPSLPKKLSRVVNRCLAKDPDERYQSAIDVRIELQDLAKSHDDESNKDQPSVAVLPFVDMSPDKDQGYFCAGMAEELISAFSHVEGLKVPSRTASFRFGDSDASPKEIAADLGVTTVLDGSVRKSNHRLRVTVELVAAESGYALWTEIFDRDEADIFDIQEEIAEKVVGALEVRLTPQGRRAIQRVSTASSEAYDFYLRGREFYHQYRRRGAEYAIQMFQRAIEIDPNYALSWAGIADASAYLYLNAAHSEGNVRLAEDSSRRATELDPDAAEVQASRGLALSIRGRHEEAERAFEVAIRIDPKLFEARLFYARGSFAQGHVEQAIEQYMYASKAAPEDYQCLFLAAVCLSDLGRDDEAKEVRLEAIRRARLSLDRHPDDTRAVYLTANALISGGERERGLRWASRALKMEPDEPLVLYNLACIYARTGMLDDALTALRRSVGTGLMHIGWIQHDTDLDPLRQDPRFRKLMDEIAESVESSENAAPQPLPLATEVVESS